MRSDLLAGHARVRERIRREELRPIRGELGPVPLRGAHLTWTQAIGYVASPGVYVVPWTTLVTATDDVSWSASDRTHVHLNTPGLWSAQLRCEARLGATTLFAMAMRLVARLKLDGEEIAAEVGAPFPVSDPDAPFVSHVELELPPVRITSPGVLTAELLPGFGVASPSGTKLKAGLADLSLYLVSE